MTLFIDAFSTVPDPRADINIQHNLMDIIFLAVAAVISGATGWKDIYVFGIEKIEWLQRYRQFKNGIPTDDTLARVISTINPDALNRAFIQWVNSIRHTTNQPQIAIDGKTLRSAHDGDHHQALHSISVWCKDSGLVLAQQKSKGKKNEQETVLDVLDMLSIRGAIISVDAMNTQKKIADKIIDSKADYVFCIKGNHKNLRDEIIAFFHKTRRDTPRDLFEHVEIDSGHGRIETRTCRQLAVSSWLSHAAEWSGIQTVIELERLREHKRSGEKQTETQYFISSLPIDAAHLASLVRSHWEVENKVHWVLDIVFKEDSIKIHKNDGAENMGILRRLALNLVRLHPDKASLRGRLMKAGWNDDFRAKMMFGR